MTRFGPLWPGGELELQPERDSERHPIDERGAGQQEPAEVPDGEQEAPPGELQPSRLQEQNGQEQRQHHHLLVNCEIVHFITKKEMCSASLYIGTWRSG